MQKAGYLFLLILVSLVFSPFVAWGAVFTVHNPAEFHNALATAQSNGEDDTIHVAPGTYNITSTLQYITADGDGALTIQALEMNNRPVLSGGNGIQIMYIENDSDQDHKGDAGADMAISGIVFQDGNCSAEKGAGLYANTGAASITLDGCTFGGNLARYGGGAYLYADAGMVSVTHNVFNENEAGFGGGVHVESSSGMVTVENNTFSGNRARTGGGVLVSSESDIAVMTDNIFTGNTAVTLGGGAYVVTSAKTAVVTNNVFSKNSAGLYGGGIAASTRSDATVTNNTFTGNAASKLGGGAYIMLAHDMAIASIYNNIFWDNKADNGGNDGDDLCINSDSDGNGAGSTVNIYNNCLGQDSDFNTGQSEDLYVTATDNYSHGSNITADPLFVDPAHGDLHLTSASPCVDKGFNNAPGIPGKDIEGQPRFADGDGDTNATVDMGAYEYATQGGGSSAQDSAATLGVVVARMKDNGDVYLYVPSLLLPVQGKLSIFELLFRVVDLNSIMFRMEDARPLSTAPGPASAFFNPGQELFYASYVALIDSKGNTTVFKNLTFNVAIGENEIFIILRDLLGDQAPTIAEYLGGTKHVGIGVPPEVSTYYLDMMAYIENLIKGTAFTTPQAPVSSSAFHWDIQDW